MADDISIRPVRAADIPTISILDYEIFGQYAYRPFFIRQAYDVFGDLFLVAENSENDIVGYVLGALESGITEGWILSLAVKKEYRRRSIANMLMEDVLKRFSARGATVVLLTVSPENEGARKFYWALDFHDEEIVPDYFGQGETRIVMRKDL